MEYVAYYRVSTAKQGASGLGLDAQQAAVASYNIVSCYTEVESGKCNTRPQLEAALEDARKRNATLLVAKLDRLSRNVAFISKLMESGVAFVAADNPTANKLLLHIMAAFAEHERDAISQRTRDALAQAKLRGTKLGNPNPQASLSKGKATQQAKAKAYTDNVMAVVRELQGNGIASLYGIANALNARGITTRRGNTWTRCGVSKLLVAGTSLPQQQPSHC